MRIRPVFTFIAGTVIAYLCLELLMVAVSPVLGPPLKSWNTMQDAKILKLRALVDGRMNPDTIFMGDSTVYIGVNPNIVNQDLKGVASTFNAGMNGSDLATIYQFLLDDIIPTSHPKRVIVLLSNLGMMSVKCDVHQSRSKTNVLDGSRLFAYRNTFRDPMWVNTLLRSIKHRSTHEGIVYRWAADLDPFGYSVFGQDTATQPSLGWDDHSLLGIQATTSSGLWPNSCLLAMRDAMLKEGGELIIGTVPTSLLRGDFREGARTLAREMNVKFIQGNDAVKSGLLFADGVHLNDNGAETFSHFLASQIKVLMKSN